MLFLLFSRFNPPYCRWFPTLTCVAGNGLVRSLRDNEALSQTVRNDETASIMRSGARNEWYGAPSEAQAQGKLKNKEVIPRKLRISFPWVRTPLG